MRKALLIFALLIGIFLTIGCTDIEDEDELEDDEELGIEDDDLGISESSGDLSGDSDNSHTVTGTEELLV
ncbi:hypothetical protein [Methanolobus halotolerans]|uniref:Uncharacterized protein n=1 Tax=Methanolobus halotolerans TaxID=2052935 RepID=A0A4E0QSQ9_9EURY|nr:hypothetical protein [Methanolobus halotolerans]TGC10678.1 hypothetical protein CUN85_04160 [Methanolobus halotolerans]